MPSFSKVPRQADSRKRTMKLAIHRRLLSLLLVGTALTTGCSRREPDLKGIVVTAPGSPSPLADDVVTPPPPADDTPEVELKEAAKPDPGRFALLVGAS